MSTVKADLTWDSCNNALQQGDSRLASGYSKGF